MEVIESVIGAAADVDKERFREEVIAIYGKAADLRLSVVEVALALSIVQDAIFRDHGVVTLPESVVTAMKGE